MATKTLTCQGAKYGTASYGTTASNKIIVGSSGSGYTPYKARLQFEGIPAGATITKFELHMYAITNTIQDQVSIAQKFGGTASDSWSENPDSMQFTFGTGTGWKTIDLTTRGGRFANFNSTWYMVVSKGTSTNTYIEWAYGGNNTPYIYIEYTEGASVPTVSPIEQYAGQSVTINTNRTNNNYTHTLKYSFGNLIDQSIATNVTTSYSWTIPQTQDVMNQFGTGENSKQATIDCWTYNNGVEVGRSYVYLQIKKPTGNGPTINPSLCSFESTTTVNNTKVFIQGKSGITATISASASGGATISRYEMTVAGVTYISQNNVITSNVISSSGYVSATIRATDSYGRTSTATFSSAAYFYPYSTPNVEYFSVERCSDDGTEYKADGTRVRINASCTISNLGGPSGINNPTRILVAVQSKLSTSDSWNNIAQATAEGYSYRFVNFAISLNNVYDITNSYDFRISVTDALGSYAVATTDLSTRSVVFDVYQDGTGFAIGKTAEAHASNNSGGFFDVQWDTEFRHKVKVDGDLTVDGTNIATKLKNTRNIALTGLITGNANFDGSEDISINTTMPYVLGLGYGGTGQAASSSFGLIQSLGLDIRAGYIGAAGSYANIWNPAMKNIPIVVAVQRSGGTVQPIKISDVTTTGFTLTGGGTSNYYIAIACPSGEVSPT